MNGEVLITLQDAALRLGLHPGHLWRMVTKQGFPAVRIGGVWRVRVSDVEDAIANGWQPTKTTRPKVVPMRSAKEVKNR